MARSARRPISERSEAPHKRAQRAPRLYRARPCSCTCLGRMPLSTSTLSILLARIHDTQIGLSAAAVREIVRAVAIAPLAGAPGVIEGAVNLHGRIVPVIDVRLR